MMESNGWKGQCLYNKKWEQSKQKSFLEEID